MDVAVGKWLYSAEAPYLPFVRLSQGYLFGSRHVGVKLLGESLMVRIGGMNWQAIEEFVNEFLGPEEERMRQLASELMDDLSP